MSPASAREGHRSRAEQYRSEDEEDEEAHFGWAGLPDALDGVVVEDGVAGDDGNVFDLRLRDEKPVEWVSVEKWHTRHESSMWNLNVEDPEAVAVNSRIEEFVEGQGKFELTHIELDGNFPDAD